MVLLDIINLSAGIDKGIATSLGVDVPYTLPFVAAVSAFIGGTQYSLASLRKNAKEGGAVENKLDAILESKITRFSIGGPKNYDFVKSSPFICGLKGGALRGAISATELTVGFFAGYMGHQMYYSFTN